MISGEDAHPLFILRATYWAVGRVFVHSLITVAMTIQWSTRQSNNITNASFIFETYVDGYDTFFNNRTFIEEQHNATKTLIRIQSSDHFLDTDTGQWFSWSLTYMLVPVVYLLSIFLNITNITIFTKAGLTDGVSVIFLSLSISDMLYSSFYIINRVLRLSQNILGQHPYVQLAHLAFIFGWYGRLFFDISILITVFAGVQKCACVAIPLTFRNFFTFRKSVGTLVSLCLCTLIYYMPRLCISYLEAKFDHQRNRTRFLIAMINFQNFATSLTKIHKLVNNVSLPIVAQAILIFCVVVMTYKLRQAAATRQSMTPTVDQTAKYVEKDKKSDAAKGSFLSKKELRVIRSVNIICVVFIAGTAPKCIIEACNLALSDFGDFSFHQSLYFFINSLQDLIIGLSIAANIVVYYKFNTKYRNTFHDMFSSLLKETQRH